MKKITLLIINLLIAQFIMAQLQIEWQANFGGTGDDMVHAIEQTTDGGYIAIGYTFSNNGDVNDNHGDSDLWIVKISASGNLEWENNFGGSSVEFTINAKQTQDGGYIIAGHSASNDGDISENNGNYDFWIVKLSPAGNILWENNFGGSQNERPHDVQQTNDGGYILAGFTGSDDGDVSANNGTTDVWIVKLDMFGNLEWENNYGGSSNEQAYGIVQTIDGGYIIAAYTYSDNGDLTSNNGGSDGWVIKIDISGNLEWQQNYGGSNNDWANSIQNTNDGGYIIGGTSGSTDGDVFGNNGGLDAWVLKLDAAGNIEWSNSYGGSDEDALRFVRETSDLGFVAIGSCRSNDGDLTANYGILDVCIFKLDISGNLEWQDNYGGSGHDWGHSVNLTNDGGYIIGASSTSTDFDVTDNYGDSDFWIVKLSDPLSVSNLVDQTKHFDIFPNPSNGQFSIIQNFGNSAIDVHVFDLLGNTIFKKENAPIEIDLQNIAKGAYFVSIQNNQFINTRKILIH